MWIKDYYQKIKQQGFWNAIRTTYYNRSNRYLQKAMNGITKKKPLEPVIIMESHNDFDNNAGAFFEYLLEEKKNEDYKIVWLIRNPKPKTLPPNVYAYSVRKPSIKKAYYLSVAKYIIGDHVVPEKNREGQKSIYLTHGSFGLKSIKGKIILPKTLDYFLCPSPEIAPLMKEEHLITDSHLQFISFGYPVQDRFYDASKGDLEKITSKKYKKVLLWMPTMRKSKLEERNDLTTEFPLGVPVINTEEEVNCLNQFLAAENMLLILKIHPMQRLEDIKIESQSNILVINGAYVKEHGIDNYRLMKDVDALISDYSSTAYDFLHLNRPIAYTMDDLKDYKLGLIVPNPEDYMAGPVILDFEGLMEFIKDVSKNCDSYKAARKAVLDKIYQWKERNSSKRIMEFLGI